MATCKDGDEQIFPLAFGVGDGESNVTWKWYLWKLKGVIGEAEVLVIESESFVPISFPNVFHEACIYHIHMDMRAKWKDNKGLCKMSFETT